MPHGPHGRRLADPEAVFHWRKVTELLAGQEDVPEAREMLGHARVRLALAQSRSVGAPDAAGQLAEAVRELGDADSVELAWALATLAAVRNGAGEVAEAQRLGAEAVAMARRVGDPATLAAALGFYIICYPVFEFPDESRACVAELDRLCASDTSLRAALVRLSALVLGVRVVRL